MGLFRRSEKTAAEPALMQRAPRSSSGWADILRSLQSSEGLRVLDFGATSPSNINYLTGLGHSVYMANVVEDASRPEWRFTSESGGEPKFDADIFADINLDFSGKEFDVVLLWDTADYLPPELVPVLFVKLCQVLRPGGKLLAFFHGHIDGPESGFARYQLTETKELVLLPIGRYPVQRVYHVRQIETFLSGYADVRFFLGKDNIREVIAQR